jgi:hypothetical protein
MLTRLRDFLFRRGGRPAPEAAREAAGLTPQLARLDELEKLETAIRTVLEIDAQKLAGRVFVVSLDVIRQRYGNSWRFLSEKARRAARNYISEQVTKEDILVPVGEVDFILVLLHGPRREAPARALRIDQGMTTSVTGEDLGLLGATAKEIVVDEGGAIRFRGLTHADIKNAQAPPAEAVIDLESELVDDEEGDDGFPSVDKVIDGLQFRIESVVRAVDKVPVAQRVGPYSPVLGEDSDERIIYENFADPKVRAKIDLRALKTARQELRRVAAEKSMLRIVAPVFFETIANSYTRNLFIKVAQKIPQAARRQLVIEVLGVPAGVAQSRLAELASVVRPFSGAAILGLAADFRDFRPLAELGLFAVSGDGTGGESLDGLYEGARLANIPIYVANVDEPKDRERVVASGATYVSGRVYAAETAATAA